MTENLRKLRRSNPRTLLSHLPKGVPRLTEGSRGGLNTPAAYSITVQQPICGLNYCFQLAMLRDIWTSEMLWNRLSSKSHLFTPPSKIPLCCKLFCMSLFPPCLPRFQLRLIDSKPKQPIVSVPLYGTERLPVALSPFLNAL